MFNSNRKFRIQTGWFITIAAMLLLLPLKFMCCWILSAAIHEMFHLMCMRLCGVKIRYISVSVGGTIIGTDVMDPATEALCALSGPLGGLVLILFRRICPLLAVCAGLQTLFNLLPLYPLDGGRVFNYIVSCMRNTRNAYIIQVLVEWIVIGSLLFFSVLAMHIGLGPVPLICCFFLVKNRKRPCKESQQIVQYT